LPDTKVVTFTQALYDEAKIDGWTVISMKNNWKRIFAFEQRPSEMDDPRRRLPRLATRPELVLAR
jgi:hypothetical protein